MELTLYGSKSNHESPGHKNANQAWEWAKVFFMAALIIALVMWAQNTYASDGTEFQDASDKFQNWVKGNLGKLAAFICLAIGSIMAAFKKDWTWFMGSVVLSLGMGIMVGIINASFSATI